MSNSICESELQTIRTQRLRRKQTVDQRHSAADDVVAPVHDAPGASNQRARDAVPDAHDHTSSDHQLSRSPRYPITRGLIAIPVLSNHCPDLTHCAEGFTVEIGQDGVTFEIPAQVRPANSKWALGIENGDGELSYCAVASRNVSQQVTRQRIDATFLLGSDDPLDSSHLLPVFDPVACQFRAKIPAAALEQWEQLGVVHRQVTDRILVCPRCEALPTLRLGCRACGAINVESDSLMHHFACAHVDLVERFEFENEIICPKCRARNLVVGSDFELVDGPFVCHDCQWSDSEIETIARCMACGNEFPEDQTVEKEVIGYHVDRLEPLDLVPAH